MQDLTSKSVFQNGYAAAPQTVTRDLFKASVTSQHTVNGKAAHPLGMAQISKGGIPFGPSANASEATSHKTPARPQAAAQPTKSAAKPALRSSPRFQNGEAIELPEIQTDEESDEEEAQSLSAPAWADPRQIQEALALQESMDPLQIFGAPGPLNMEEIFKNKERFHKFRARTSSANWSGADRLTEDDIRKDMAARDKLRRDGGWSYEMGRELV